MTKKLSDLRKPLPSDKISYREQDGRQIAYIAWHDAADVLDESCPDGEIAGPWTSRIVSIQNIDNRLCVTMAVAVPYKVESEPEAITVNLNKTQVSISYVERQAIGFEYLIDPKTGKEISYGDAFSNASSMAFRRCCALFGIGRDLYKKGAAASASRAGFESAARADEGAAASGDPNLVTPRQLAAIYAIGRSKDIGPAGLCAEMFKGMTPETLSRKQASALIERLNEA